MTMPRLGIIRGVLFWASVTGFALSLTVLHIHNELKEFFG